MINFGGGVRAGTRRTLVALLVAVAAVVMPVAVAAPASAATPTGRLAQFDTDLLHLVNQARVAHGAPALQSDGGLVSLAAWWSGRMAGGATGGQLEHNPDAWSMLADYGAGNRTAWAENVASFSPGVTPQALFNAYMASPGHRANILNARYRYVGIGTVNGPYGEFDSMEFTDQVEPGGCHPFYDVDSTSVHCQNVGWLSQRAITTPAGRTYRPFQAVTREAMAAFLFRLTHPGASAPACHSRPFRDVPTTDVFCGYIAWAKASGVVGGYADGTYRPDAVVSRGAMAAYLARIASAGSVPPCTSRPFADVAVSSTFCGEIAWMKAHGITEGFGSSTYDPALRVTRQAMASFLHREAPLV